MGIKRYAGFSLRRGWAWGIVFAALLGHVARAAENEAPPAEGGVEPAVETDSASSTAAPSRAIEVVNDPIEASVVKVIVSVRRPDLSKPWMRSSAVEATGSGVVIEGKRILTCAHVIANASEVLVQPSQSSERLVARVVFVARGVDLALLELEDDNFFATHPPLAIDARAPALKSTVLAYGFPKGGSALAVTRGIVSRVEFARYNSGGSGLRVQIDAPINPGNSGGPAIVRGKVVGLATSGITSAQNIGYLVPGEEIGLFLTDVKDGSYEGKPALFDRVQDLEHAGLRTALGLPPKVSGVVVLEADNPAADYPLRERDVITHVAGVPLDQQGYVKLGDLRVRYSYLVQQKAPNGRVPMTLWRDGAEVNVLVPTETARPHLVADYTARPTPYLVYGPLVFSIATIQFVQGQTALPRPDAARPVISMLLGLTSDRNPFVERLGDRQAFSGEELVVVSARPLAHPLSRGLPQLVGQVVDTCNGQKVKNLAHLAELLRDSTATNTVLHFGGRAGPIVALPHGEALAATEAILADNSIRALASPEILKVWEARGPAALKDAPAKTKPTTAP